MSERIRILRGDITQQKVDAIVNAANTSLLGGSGVDGAIHSAAGPELLEYCKTLGGCLTGHAKITPGFRLKAKYIIHTVGPVWRGGNYNEDELLANCYKNSIRLAVKNKLKSIAFPAISTGVYGFPLERASGIALNTAMEFLNVDESFEKIVFVCFDDRAFNIYNQTLKEITEINKTDNS